MWLSRKYCNLFDAITRSITLHATQVKDTGRYFSTWEDKPLLYTGKTVAFFQSSGNLPNDIKLENNIERGPASTLESFIKKTGRRLSGPLDSLGLIF